MNAFTFSIYVYCYYTAVNNFGHDVMACNHTATSEVKAAHEGKQKMYILLCSLKSYGENTRIARRLVIAGSFILCFCSLKRMPYKPKTLHEKKLCCHFKSTLIHWWLGKRLAVGHFHIGWLDPTASLKIAASRYCKSRSNQKWLFHQCLISSENSKSCEVYFLCSICVL